jgi:hypothetical protein
MMLAALLSIALAAPSAAPPPPRLPASEHAPERAGTPALKRHHDGRLEHKDRVSGFSATIHPDGRVTFKDHAPVRMESPTLLGFDVFGRKQEPPDETFNQKSNTLVHRGTHADSKNDMLVKWGPYGAAPILAGVGGRFPGVSDFATSTRRAHAKRRFLDHTAEMRAEMAEQHQRTNEKQALVRLSTDLRIIWADGATPVSLRKEKLFVLWDECEEMIVADGEADSDPEQAARATAGAHARRQIEAFIRKNAPRGSADAFTPAELKDMNARRRSKAEFEPYRITPP